MSLVVLTSANSKDVSEEKVRVRGELFFLIRVNTWVTKLSSYLHRDGQQYYVSENTVTSEIMKKIADVPCDSDFRVKTTGYLRILCIQRPYCNIQRWSATIIVIMSSRRPSKQIFDIANESKWKLNDPITNMTPYIKSWSCEDDAYFAIRKLSNSNRNCRYEIILLLKI